MNEADVLEAYPDMKDDKGGKILRVIRGASWSTSSEIALRSSFRISYPPRVRRDAVGFRCVLSVG